MKLFLKMKSKLLFAVMSACLLTFGSSGVFALEVTGVAPQVPGNAALQTAINNAWGHTGDPNSFMGQLQKDLGGIEAFPKKLIQGFADASVFSSQGATQRGYGEPKLFNLTIGSIVGIQGIDGIMTASDDMQTNGDTVLGLDVQAVNFQLNFNTTKLLSLFGADPWLDGLDLGLRFGVFKLDKIDIQDTASIEFETFQIGVVANYQFIKAVKVVPFLLTWRGLNFGTGVIFQNSKFNYGMVFDPITQNLGGAYTDSQLRIDPKLAFSMKNFTVTIPLEATTAVQLFGFLNIPLGIGADIAFGKNDMSLDMDSTVSLTGSAAAGATPGSVSVSGGGDMAPHFFNFKVMSGVGFKFGPVIIDMPVTLYIGEAIGANVGITFGFTL